MNSKCGGQIRVTRSGAGGETMEPGGTRRTYSVPTAKVRWSFEFGGIGGKGPNKESTLCSMAVRYRWTIGDEDG